MLILDIRRFKTSNKILVKKMLIKIFGKIKKRFKILNKRFIKKELKILLITEKIKKYIIHT